METIAKVLSKETESTPRIYANSGNVTPVFRVVCTTCQGTGYIREDRPLDHPLFGRLTPCPDCAVGKRLDNEIDEYGLLTADRALTWKEVYDTEEVITRAKNAVIETLERGWGYIYLCGGFGTAKTHILKTAVAESLRAGSAAVYARMGDIFDTIREAYDAQNPQTTALKRLNWFSSGVQVLAIDEIDKVKDTDFVTEKRFSILDRRYEVAVRAHWGVTIIAGNQRPEFLGGALASRIYDERFTVIEITASDARRISNVFEGAK